MLATATVIAQEYHGEMERLYPDKTKTTKKTTKKNTPTEKKTDTVVPFHRGILVL